MWTVDFARDANNQPLGKNRIDSYRKKHPAAVGVMRKRVDMIIKRLNLGADARDALAFGWVHPEKGGVFGVDPLPDNPPLRMYCVLKMDAWKLLILTIGEKKRQQADLNEVFAWVAAL